MKIVYFHQYFVLPSQSGGIRSYEMAKRLVKDGHEVDLVTTSAMMKGWERKGKSAWSIVNIEGIRVHVLDLPYSNDFGFVRRMMAFLAFSFRSAMYAMKLNCDLVFATSTPLTIGIPAVLVSTLKRKPLVFEVRDLWPEVPIAMGVLKGWLPVKLARMLERLIYSQSESVIALSPGMAVGVKKISDVDVHVISNAADIELFQDVDRVSYDIKNLSPALEGGGFIVYTGTIGKVNGLSYLVRLASELSAISKKYKIVVFGAGAEYQSVRSLAIELGVWETAFFIFPMVPKDHLPSILSQASISVSTVLPIRALWENSANKFFDALAAGIPVAVNHGGWLADIIKNEKIGVVLDPEDVAASASRLIEFLDDKERVEFARKAAFKLGSTDFSRDVLYRKFERILSGACKA